MQKKPNHKLRAELKQNGLYIWQLAQAVGIHETTLTKWLRTPLNDEQQARVDEAMQELIKENKVVNT